MGLLLAVVVHAANIQDRDGAKLLFTKVKGCFPRLKLIWADGAYAGQLIQWVATTCQWVLEIVKRCDQAVGFKVLPRRWVVERTFGWLGRYRRLSKDYEYLTETSETMIQISMIQLMLRRLTRTTAAHRVVSGIYEKISFCVNIRVWSTVRADYGSGSSGSSLWSLSHRLPCQD